MQMTMTRLSAAAYRGGDPPQAVIAREPGAVWVTPHAPVELEQPIRWFHHKRESHVLIPAYPYLTPPHPDAAAGFMFQLGLRAVSELAAPVARVHTVVVSPAHQIIREGRESWQLQLGFALLLAKE